MKQQYVEIVSMWFNILKDDNISSNYFFTEYSLI